MSHRNHRFARFVAWLVVGLALWVVAAPARACPFCSAVSQTFSEEMGTVDACVVTKLVALPPAEKPGQELKETPKAKFEILEVIKGKGLKKGETIETVYFGDGKLGKTFLVMGVDPPNLMWSTPLEVSERGRKYVTQLPKLPAEGPERLEFFQAYLEDADEMLARDAYDEFAKAPYASVIGLKDKMNHDQLVGWIKDEEVPANRRRLYLTMLGVCGTKADVPMLEEMLKSNDRKARSGLDALIGCYLTLVGEEGMPLVEDLFLKNDKSEYADTYAAIMALRFHGSETDVVPRQRILQALRHMLDRPQLADLVIPDLARWEDWSVMGKLVDLFKNADEKSSWVRVPVINYLRACPKPEAKAYIQELEKIDPAAVKRANTFFPFGPGVTPPAATPPAKTQTRIQTRGGETALEGAASTQSRERDQQASAGETAGLAASDAGKKRPWTNPFAILSVSCVAAVAVAGARKWVKSRSTAGMGSDAFRPASKQPATSAHQQLRPARRRMPTGRSHSSVR